MVVYCVVMFAVSVLFSAFSILIYKGKTDLIHDYHQTKVTNKTAYGRAFGKAMAVIAGTMALSGVVALFGESAMWGAVAVLLGGLTIGIVSIVRIQKKYNGGVFR